MKRFNLHPKQFYKSLFSPEQWREIYAVRAELEAYRNKVQPYPALPAEEEPKSMIVEIPWSHDQWQYVQQLRAQVNYLNTKVTELQAKKKTQPPAYKGLST